ncbi:MAG TPA: flagellar assembly peptidoglycan hydrolase FlgJ, partial [Candidatus Dormibacteraeota bacterium]|nr:flagellar assembly peptidoglycan hydrolase FlgJ [Candidatus Dormibacteraeota bacterium]
RHLMTAPVNNAGMYGDFAGLEKLKAGVRGNDAAAVRQVAQQFESLFARMMLKSMRKAIGTDPIFGSDQAQMYQGMFDDQLSLDLTRGRGLGLADMLMRQLRGGSRGAAAGVRAGSPAALTGTSSAPAPVGPAPTAVAAPTGAERAQFIRDLWPQAERAGRQLGVHPVGLIAQAALESNWGRSMPQSSSGSSSHNLFGVKAAGAWHGSAVTASTREFADGSASTVPAAFRAYASPEAGWQDYVALVGGNARYRAALNSGDDIGAYAGALQRGGYATDPAYAHKVTAVARQVAAVMADPAFGQIPVKFAEVRPITAGTATL